MVTSIPPRGDADEVRVQMAAARREVGQATLASQVARAQSQLEGLAQAVRAAQASGDGQRAQALAGEAARIGRGLARLGASDGPGMLAETMRMAREVEALAAGRECRAEGTDLTV